MKTTFLIILCLPIIAMAKVEIAAKVLLLRGKVYAQINGKVIKLKRGAAVPVGAKIKTKSRSFAKLIFIDKSTLNIGPQSVIKIEAFPKNKAGILNLIKGKIRSKVTKNYMNMKKGQSKLFIRTKTAAMGVRGTDYECSYNPKSKTTSTIVYSGNVVMAKIQDNRKHFNQRQLERRVSSRNAVSIRTGQFSSSRPGLKQVTIPIKISPRQLRALKSNDLSHNDSGDKNEQAHKEKKMARNIAPPGLESHESIINNGSMDQLAVAAMGTAEMTKVNERVEARKIERDKFMAAPASGFVQGEHFAPKAGGIIDMATGTYIAPPAGSTFDPNTGVYQINTAVAAFDTNGNFKSEILKINDKGMVSLQTFAPIASAAQLTKVSGDTKQVGVTGKGRGKNRGKGQIGRMPATANTPVGMPATMPTHNPLYIGELLGAGRLPPKIIDYAGANNTAAYPQMMPQVGGSTVALGDTAATYNPNGGAWADTAMDAGMYPSTTAGGDIIYATDMFNDPTNALVNTANTTLYNNTVVAADAAGTPASAGQSTVVFTFTAQ